MAASMDIGVIGVGYVGLVTATCFADLGHRVVCRDIVPARIDALQDGQVPLYEPGIDRLIERNRERLVFTLDMADVFATCRIVFVCVDTPPTVSGDADLSRVRRVIEELPDTGERFVLVMKSTVPVGTGERLRAELDARGLTDVGYVSNPEFLREGRAISDFKEPDRIVVGSFTDEDGDAVAALYADIDAPIVRTDVPSAEMIKYASNAFLATKISFINEIANVCEEVGADVGVVSHGMGLDDRIGSHFLRPGIGYGGSCLAGEETVLVRIGGAPTLMRLDALHRAYGGDDGGPSAIEPLDGLEVLAWDREGPSWQRVSLITSRFVDDIVEVRTKLGRRVVCTADHPFVVGDGAGDGLRVKLAGELDEGDWLPVTQGMARGAAAAPDDAVSALEGMWAAGVRPGDVIIRLGAEGRAELARTVGARAGGVMEARRLHDARRSGTVRLDQAFAAGISLDGAAFGTARNGTYVPAQIQLTPAFWRIVGLYLAEGCVSREPGGRCRISWHFHPHDEDALVQEVAGYWRSLGVKATVSQRPTAAVVSVSSRLLTGLWTGVFGLGENSYEQRIPDAIWDRPREDKLALLAGMWLGDGSWSLVDRGPSVVLEYGTASRALADGALRLLGELGVAARVKVGRTARSTQDTYWLVISGADQVEALLDLVDAAERDEIAASLARLQRRIAPAGYRRADGAAFVRLREVRRGLPARRVYSLEVPGPQTFVTTHGLVVHNCFPKDVRALKQLAGNSGYHFQLLTSVIEVNELQKRRVVGKLERHLGSLRGRRIALLGLAFKANTDDMREAASLVLAARLRAEGADVVAYDPVAMDAAGPLLGADVQLAGSALEAVTGASAAVIVTEWGEFRSLATPEVRDAMETPLVVDGRNLLDPEAARAAGFIYEGVGRGRMAVTHA